MNESAQTVLIVEDEPSLAALLDDYLKQSGYHTHVISDGSQVLPFVKETLPALITLDIMLPGKDGISICREIREFSYVPIIMVTAKIEEIDRLLGLELGADDYICKPFSPRELIARVKAVLRRGSQDYSVPYSGLKMIESRLKAELNGQELDLTAVEFQLLKILASEPGRIFSRSKLMDAIYNDHRVVSNRTIDSHIKKLRNKIALAVPEDDSIRSIYGLGYKFEK